MTDRQIFGLPFYLLVAPILFVAETRRAMETQRQRLARHDTYAAQLAQQRRAA